MREYMKNLMQRIAQSKERNMNDFRPDIMVAFNKRAKNENYYGYDKYGIIVRKDASNNTKSPFGWIRNSDDEIVSIHLKMDCPEDTRKMETMTYIQTKFASQWNNRNNVLRRIYDRYEHGCNADDAIELSKISSKRKK